MSSDFKIPTLLGLAIITAGLIAGGLLVSTRQVFFSQADLSVTPKQTGVTNIAATSASIFWQTDQETSGFIEAGTSPRLNLTFEDDRQRTVLQNNRLHFVTLTNLSPNTTYYYKFHSGGQIYPPGNPLTFTTAKPIPINQAVPLVGTVVTSNRQPVKEAFIALEIPGAENLATITKTAGNFVLSLGEIYRVSFEDSFPLGNTKATLKITDGNQSSQVTLTLPIKEPLPPIILGQDTDLALPAPNFSGQSVYDFNLDGQVNSLDLSIILKNIKKTDFVSQADINNDGAVNQNDLDIFTDYLSQARK